MNDELQQIYHQFKGKLIGKPRTKTLVCETLMKMPVNIVEYVTSTCWFLSSMEDAWAFAFTGNDLRDQHLIFLSDELLAQDETQIQYTIAHEIGHIMLKHRNSTFTNQTQAEITQQEREADAFARSFVSAPTV